MILDAGSAEMKTWLDPHRTTWSKELQSLLKPYEGELECYPVSKDVGKVGNNSPDFIVPLNSKDNKKNIANFFASSNKEKPPTKPKDNNGSDVSNNAKAENDTKSIKHEDGENRETKNVEERTEDNAPLPIPKNEVRFPETKFLKREHSPTTEEKIDHASHKAPKTEKSENSPLQSPTKTGSPSNNKKTRSATSNGPSAKANTQKKASKGTQPITNFFKK